MNAKTPVLGESQRTIATVLGIVAIILWGTALAFSRSTTEAFGILTAAAYIHLASGAIACLFVAFSKGGLSRLIRLPRLYLFGCGALFVIYIACFYGAVGLAASREQAIEVGIVNYLWPSMTLLLSVPLLGKRPSWALAPGVLMACAGIILASAHRGTISWGSLMHDIGSNGMPFALALIAAISWGLYSNLTYRWGGESGGNGVPLFLLAAGLVLLLMRQAVTEHSHWTLRSATELAYMSLFPTLLAYLFWERAMRHGDLVLVTSLSYFTPLLSVVFGVLYLGVAPGWTLWMACVLVIAGAILCRWSLSNSRQTRGE